MQKTLGGRLARLGADLIPRESFAIEEGFAHRLRRPVDSFLHWEVYGESTYERRNLRLSRVSRYLAYFESPPTSSVESGQTFASERSVRSLGHFPQAHKQVGLAARVCIVGTDESQSPSQRPEIGESHSPSVLQGPHGLAQQSILQGARDNLMG